VPWHNFCLYENVRPSEKEGLEMGKRHQKKILLAVDGSEQALDAVRYIGELEPFRGMRVVLFTVFDSVPESYRDSEKDPRLSRGSKDVWTWKVYRRKVILFLDTEHLPVLIVLVLKSNLSHIF
jgi:hypothetical protein